MTSVQQPVTPAAGPVRPQPPATVEDTGLPEEFITDLLLKVLYVQGARTGQQLVDVVKLPFPFVDNRLLDLQQRRLAEVRGTTGHSRAGYVATTLPSRAMNATSIA